MPIPICINLIYYIVTKHMYFARYLHASCVVIVVWALRNNLPRCC